MTVKAAARAQIRNSHGYGNQRKLVAALASEIEEQNNMKEPSSVGSGTISDGGIPLNLDKE